jgi:hypothetical protein
MKYILRAYKENSSDYCMGCHMESYDSDYIEEGPLSEEELIKAIARIKTIELSYKECGYEIWYEIYQPEEISHEKSEEINNRVSTLIDDILLEKERKKKETEENEKKKMLEKQRLKELAKLKELKEKYES